MNQYPDDEMRQEMSITAVPGGSQTRPAEGQKIVDRLGSPGSFGLNTLFVQLTHWLRGKMNVHIPWMIQKNFDPGFRHLYQYLVTALPRRIRNERP